MCMFKSFLSICELNRPGNGCNLFIPMTDDADLLKGAPEFIKETPECTYMFSWASALACVPVKTTSCSFK